MPAPTEVRAVALHTVDERDAARVGSKAARLGALARAGLAVPEALLLDADAYRVVLDAAGLGEESPPEAVRAAPLPPEVDAALHAIAGHFGDVRLAVRSSAIGEDGADSSYAGQFSTVLGVQGLAGLRDAVRECWASAHAEPVRTYRAERGLGDTPMAVLVQRQVAADVAGVAFTADPLDGCRDVVLVSAVPGLGSGLVDGSVEPDEWSVSGSAATPIRVRHRALAAAQAIAVAELAGRIEQLLGGPQDVEWAMADGRLVVLQARPVTALPQAPRVDLPPGTWVKEVERHPEPMTEFGASGVARFVARGLTRMVRESGGLVDRFDLRAIGGEPYLQVVPLGGRGGPPPPWWLLAVLARVAPPMRRQMRRAAALLEPGVLAGFQTRWEQEWRPALQADIRTLQRAQLTELDDDAFAAHFEQALALLDRSLDLHFQLTAPYLIPVHDLLVECRKLGWPDSRGIELLAGTSQATSAPTLALRELAAAVAAKPHAVAAVEVAAGALGADLAARLAAVDPALGTSFLGWCSTYGQRCVNDDPGSPTIAELPQVLASLLRDAVHAVRDDLPARTARLRAERATEARALLADRPRAERAAFERALTATLRAYPMREDSAFWTASLPAGLLHTAAVEAGRRLAGRGVLDRADAVFDLDIDRVRSLLADPGSGGPEVRAEVARVRAERAYVRTHPGPAHHGPAPQPFPDLRGLPAAGRRVNEALLYMQQRGAQSVPASDGRAVLLHGVPGSGGSHTGPVRIIRGAADFHRLRAGDVLVCPTADPAWSVLFGVAGALIADGGNVLSHAAIVAREHALPAVVGTREATTTLRDGQVVTVDGTGGRVLAENTPG